MDEQQALEEIRLIKSMLEKTRKATAESGSIFLFWGVLITLALAGNYLLAFFKKYDWIWLDWLIVAGIGWVYSVVYGIRRRKKDPVRTYMQAAADHLYFACGAGFLLVGIILPWLKVYSHEAITILIASLSGILFFVMGGTHEWPVLRWFGLVWWAGAVAMSFLHGNSRILLYTVLFVALFLVPSWLLRSKFKKEQGAA